MRTPNLSIDSMDSLQDYQDSSDSSPISIKRRRRFTLPVRFHREKDFASKKKISLEIVNVSNNSNDITLRRQNSYSSLNSEVYRSESYQMLMNNAKPLNKKLLEKIDETDNFDTKSVQLDVDVNLSPASQEMETINMTNNDRPNTKTDVENSSNVTLPPSPEISIVEHISICKDLMSSLKHSNFNEQFNMSVQNMSIVSGDVDVSYPLMEQEMNFVQTQNKSFQRQSQKPKFDIHKYSSTDENMSGSNKVCTISETVINKVHSVIIEEPTISETLNGRLRNLILESAKKGKKPKRNALQESDNPLIELNNLKEKKLKSKRCSTPHKKKNIKKSKDINTLIEERMEYCAKKPRSCPSSIMLCPIDEKTMEQLSTDELKITNNKTVQKKYKKKDIIKVKITKPKNKKNKHCKNTKVKKYDSMKLRDRRESSLNNSESGIFLQGFNDSVDLIHNHTDTCLHTNECLDDSVIHIENNSSSIISLNSSNSSSSIYSTNKNTTKRQSLNSEDCFSSQAQSEISLQDRKYNSYIMGLFDLYCMTIILHNISDTTTKSNASSSNNTIISDSPNGGSKQENINNSMLTEDFSDEIRTTSRTSQWFLLSEEENTKFNDMLNPSENTIPIISYSEHIQKLFPITCAVPDLSTITEASRDTDSNSNWKTSAKKDSNKNNTPVSGVDND